MCVPASSFDGNFIIEILLSYRKMNMSREKCIKRGEKTTQQHIDK
jgi:hypothetical protein